MKRDEPRTLQPGDRIVRVLDNPWVVVALCFFVFAAFGIPLIWICKGFSTWMKVLLTILVTLYTVLILWVFALIMLWSYHRIVESL